MGETFLVSKSLMLRMLGAVYLFAFLGAALQNRALIGERGLSPAAPVFARYQQAAASTYDGFTSHPAIWWWVAITDTSLDAVAWVGAALSALVVLGFESWVAMVLLWLLDFSLVTAADGSSFYQYGWESQLLETGILAVFLCHGAPSPAVLWLFRWLCFRISMGAGLIKMRGGSCWEQRTCLYYHFETQPVPSPYP